MPEKESMDVAGVEATEQESSRNPFPEVDRGPDGTTTADQVTDDEAETTRQGDESTGRDDSQSHGCNHDSAVPCRFQ